jgi:ornithine cyclodeaminase
MLILSSENMLKTVSYLEVIDFVEEALEIYESKTYKMPDRFNYTEDGNTVLYMPCYTEKNLGTKIVSLFPENSKVGTPVIQGIMMLNDNKTGKPISIMDGSYLTSIRTGAVGGVGFKCITDKDTDNVGLIGQGAQGIYQLLYACLVRGIKRISLFSRDDIKTNNFIKGLREKLNEIGKSGIEINIYKDMGEFVKSVDNIIFATNSMTPVVSEEITFKGKKMVAIGSYKPDMREMSDSLIKSCDRIYVDTEFAVVESGDLKIPLDSGIIQIENINTISHLIDNIDGKEMKSEDTILYKSVGMALFDVVVASKIYEKAAISGVGEKIKF